MTLTPEIATALALAIGFGAIASRIGFSRAALRVRRGSFRCPRCSRAVSGTVCPRCGVAND